MKRYIENLKQLPPHDRRMHAMRVSGSITAVVALLWLGTLGMRLAAPSADVASGDSAQSAAVVSSQYGNATLLVATSTSN